MSLPDVLEWLAAFPEEAWLLPPVIVVAAIFGVTLMLRQARLNRWRAIAEHSGLRLDSKTIVHSPEVVGEYRGRRLVMTTASRRKGSWTFRKTWTRVTVEVKNPALIGLRMYRQDALDTLLTSVGLPDIRIGDETFDRRFIIRTDDKETATELLRDATLRADLVRAEVNRVEMFGTTMDAYYARDERDVAHAELLFTTVTRLADAIDALKRGDKPEILYSGRD
jgi:hypothetical protein